jgi:hypothetical protein
MDNMGRFSIRSRYTLNLNNIYTLQTSLRPGTLSWMRKAGNETLSQITPSPMFFQYTLPSIGPALFLSNGHHRMALIYSGLINLSPDAVYECCLNEEQFRDYVYRINGVVNTFPQFCNDNLNLYLPLLRKLRVGR